MPGKYELASVIHWDKQLDFLLLRASHDHGLLMSRAAHEAAKRKLAMQVTRGLGRRSDASRSSVMQDIKKLMVFSGIMRKREDLDDCPEHTPR